MPASPPPAGVLIPGHLRLTSAGQRWRLADRHFRISGTWLARGVAPWRWVCALMLCASLPAGSTAVHGTAALRPFPQPAVEGVWKGIARDLTLLAAVLVFCVAVVGMPVGPLVAVLSPILAATGVWVIENRRVLRLSWRCRKDQRHATELLVASGHAGPIVWCDVLSAQDADDAVALGRLWLAHADSAGIALVTSGAAAQVLDPSDAGDFRPVRPGADVPLVLRVPRSATVHVPVV
ncbi:hypothetical protein [Cellulomonas cellasea]|uniref:Uncharacterized protein n=1 Tax=Cellulomonas cellasea TaxID=43670 RepID=A0A7W4UDY0_9CELL|nr:hypothetical protein [Cellulomonas cellasea]MBB2921783.1 hypothetical protein [Cellulomonas cellasea]